VLVRVDTKTKHLVTVALRSIPEVLALFTDRARWVAIVTSHSLVNTVLTNKPFETGANVWRRTIGIDTSTGTHWLVAQITSPLSTGASAFIWLIAVTVLSATNGLDALFADYSCPSNVA